MLAAFSFLSFAYQFLPIFDYNWGSTNRNLDLEALLEVHPSRKYGSHHRKYHRATCHPRHPFCGTSHTIFCHSEQSHIVSRFSGIFSYPSMPSLYRRAFVQN